MRRYTIGLPSLLISKIRSSGEETPENFTNLAGLVEDLQTSGHGVETIRLSNRDWSTVRQLRSRIESVNDSDTGIVTSSVKMQDPVVTIPRSEEHTSELQSRGHLVCRLLLEKKKTQ